MTFYIDKENLWWFGWCTAAYIATRVVTGSPWLGFLAFMVTGMLLQRDISNAKKKGKR